MNNQNNDNIRNTEIYDQLDELKSQLQLALVSGGITPEMYTEIDNRIKYFEEQGYTKEAQELRSIFSQIEVGGQTAQSSATEEEMGQTKPATTESQPILWDYRDGNWKPRSEPPACPELLILKTPIDLDKVSSILYPGQIRGKSVEDYKPHGGFRTDNTDVDVQITAPMDGYVFSGVRFYDDAGIHYSFSIQNECGIQYDFGHISELSPKFQAIADTLPEPKQYDSRTSELKPVFIKTGEVIALRSQKNTGYDFGVYDFRQENEISKNQDYRELHPNQPYKDYYAVCWLDWFNPEDSAKARALPGGDGKMGKTSDYC